MSVPSGTFRVEDMPFDIGFYSERPPDIPEKLPFELRIDDENGLIRQTMTEELRTALRKYYTLGGYLSTPLGEGEYATAQGDFFLRALQKILDSCGKKVSELSFLEVGSSYGYVLHRLQSLGAREVIGVEPGDDGVVGSERYNVSIIHDFFPSKKLDGKKFDVVLSHCVLEHIEEPLAMLREMFDSTKKGGMVFFAVPECKRKMVVGDLSIIAHQHLNYFTEKTVRTLLEDAGFTNIVTMTSSKRTLLFAWGTKSETLMQHNSRARAIDESSQVLLRQFKRNFEANVRVIQTMVRDFQAAGKKIGLYAPDANLAGLITYDSVPRIFNKDVVKRGKYLVNAAGSFEEPERLITEPLDVIFIAPIDYDVQIREELSELGLSAQTELVSLKELYEREAGIQYSVDHSGQGKEFVIEREN